MRMNKIPRGVQNPTEGGPSNFNLVAEPIELGSGTQDPHVQHAPSMQPANGMMGNPPITDAEWFNQVEQRNPDPRYAQSYIHDQSQPYVQGQPVHARPRTETEHVVDGMVVGAFMQKGGAHIEVVSLDGSNIKYALFCEDTPLVRLGLKVRVSEKTKYDTRTGDVIESEIVVEDIDG